MLALDHLVVAARTLEEGAAWIESRLGVAPVAGGRHDAMGTHNRLLGLGDRQYLEVIAIDPQAPAPARKRWFGLDDPGMQARLAASPALIHWVMRSEDIEADVRAYPQAVEILRMGRGEYRWRIGVPADGSLPCNGRCPTLIQWDCERHPAEDIPDSGVRLLALSGPGVPAAARFQAPGGPLELPWGVRRE